MSDDQFNDVGFKVYEDVVECPNCKLFVKFSQWNLRCDSYEYHKHYKPHCPWIREEEAYIAFQKGKKAAQEAHKAKAKEKARIKSETEDRQARMYAEQEARNARLKEEEKIRIQAEEAAREAFACRRCSVKFASNTKLHEHVRNHHIKSSPSTPTLSLSTIKSIETPPTKLAPSPKAAPPSKSAPPLTPPATPPKT